MWPRFTCPAKLFSNCCFTLTVVELKEKTTHRQTVYVNAHYSVLWRHRDCNTYLHCAMNSDAHWFVTACEIEELNSKASCWPCFLCWYSPQLALAVAALAYNAFVLHSIQLELESLSAEACLIMILSVREGGSGVGRGQWSVLKRIWGLSFPREFLFNACCAPASWN